MGDYTIRFRQSVTEGGSTVTEELFEPVSDVVWRLSPLNEPWVNAGCYAGAIPANGSEIGSYSIAMWSGWNKDSVYSDMRDLNIRSYAGSSQQNLRFMAKYNSGGFAVDKQSFNWTNLRDATVEAIETAIEDFSTYPEYDPYRRQNKSIATGGNSNSPLNVAPLESLHINDLIWLPMFKFNEVEYYNFDDVAGGYANVTYGSSVSYYWRDIKPEDKTPAGEHYDADLFEKGWTEIEPVNEGGRRFRYCCGVYLTPYYGKCSNSYNPTTDTYTAGTNPDDGRIYGDRQIFGSVASQTDEYPVIATTTNLTRPCLLVMTESYDSVTGGLVYSLPAGISFSNIIVTGNVSGNVHALQPSWGITSDFHTFTATTSWTSEFFIGNQDYCNFYPDADPASNQAEPTLSITSCVINADIQIAVLYNITDLSNATRLYLVDNTPLAYAFQKSNRNLTATNIAFYPINSLWHTIASLGCYVADYPTTAQKAPTGYYTGNNNHLYLGHMDASGITDGIMLQGGDIPSSVQSGIDDIIQNTPYTPVIPTPPDPSPSDDGVDDTDKGTGTNLPNFGLKLAGSGGFMSYFLLGMSGLTALATALSTTAQSFWTALGTATDFRTSNLLQYISSLKWYPIDIIAGNQGFYADVDTTDITFGFDSNAKLPLGSTIKKLGTTIRVYSMGSVQIPYKLGTESFLDKDPYSTVQVWLPFCGMYPVKADFVVGNTISFYYVIDLVTGMCTALVANDRQTLLNVSGKIGVDYAVTGNDIITQSERMSGAYINSALSAIAGGINLGTSIASENAVGAVAASAGLLGDIAKSSIDIASAKRAVPVAVSSGSGFGSSFAPNTPCVIVNPPAIRIPEDYGHSKGYVYNQTVSIGSISGFTVCENPDLSGISATDAEKRMIADILTTGFYA